MIAIETTNLTKYYKKNMAIKNLNLTVKKGEIFGFIGPNGAGKSTTIRTLLNFIFPTSGSAKIMGLDIIKDTKKIKKLVGYIPSEVNYYDDMRIKELFQYSSQFYGYNLDKKIQHLSDMFEVELNKKISDLSLGNKKKVAIIQALLHAPEVLILDEPTTGLDPLMQNIFFELIKEENKKGTTIFFSSHLLNEVQKLCNKVAIIKEGKIIKIEEIEKLTKKKYKKVSIELNHPKEELPYIEGITDLSIINNDIKFLYSGDIKELLNYLSNLELKNFWIEEPSLEEIFIHYYEKETN